MKKMLILALLVKHGVALNLFKLQNNGNYTSDQFKHNANLYAYLNTNRCRNDKAIKKTLANRPLKGKPYNLTTLLSSSLDLAVYLSNDFGFHTDSLSTGVVESNPRVVAIRAQPILAAKMALAVLDSDRKYKILISDFAGQEVQSIVISNAPITSLAWDNSGNSLAYVSYESGKPVVYIQNIYTSKRYIVANFNGSNSSPAFADKAMLVSLSKDYGTHIYRIDTQNYTSKKIAIPMVATGSIDTEADYANKSLIYTSNKSSKPAIYLQASNSLPPQKISIGSNNTTGRISPDGSKVLYIHSSRGSYDLMYYNIVTGITTKIDSGKILSGSFAPDNRLISYIKNNQIISYNLDYNNAIAGLKYREILDVKWSK